MGIITALLTGGIVIGKICQAIGGGLSAKSSDANSQLAVSGDVSAGGVVFYRSNVSGPSLIYAYNPSTKSPASVVVPNGSDGSGLTYVIAPTEKIPFAEAESPLVPPSTVVTTGLTNPASLVRLGASSAAGPFDSLFKLAFSGLKVGGVVNVGSFRLSCTSTQLVIFSASINLMAITYFYFSSNKGIQASSTATIPKDPGSTTNDLAVGSESKFAIDFSALGINTLTDTLEGQLTLTLSASSAQLLALSNVPSEPLHPFEREALKKYDYLA